MVKVTEQTNLLTTSIDVADPLTKVRLLRASDAQLFSGFAGHDGLLDASTLRDIARLRAHVAEGLASGLLARADSAAAGGTLHVVMAGSGTSGRTAFMTARCCNDLMLGVRRTAARATAPHAAPPPPPPPGRESITHQFHYLNSGGDAALLRAAEGAEDSVKLAHSDLSRIERTLDSERGDRIVLVGISCGFSATYVGAMLQRALSSEHSKCYSAVVALGFNPASSTRQPVRVAGWNTTFADILRELEAVVAPAADMAPVRGEQQLRLVLRPTLGPEPIAGSTRMKGGSGTKIVLEAALCSAIMDAGALAKKHLPQTLRPADFKLQRELQCILPSTVCSSILEYAGAMRRVYSPDCAAELARLSKVAAGALRQGGSIIYLGAGTAGIIGIVDAAECPPTFGAQFRDIAGFVAGGWKTMRNVEGELTSQAGETHSMQLSLEYFRAAIMPSLQPRDIVVLLTICGGADSAETRDAQRAMLDAGAARGVQMATITIMDDGSKQASVCDPGVDVSVCVDLQSLAPRCLDMQDSSVRPPLVAEFALKLCVNAVSTCAHVMKGTVFQNCMINLRITNIKLFHRAVGLVSRLGKVAADTAQCCILRAIYGSDERSGGQSVPVVDTDVPNHVATAAAQENLLPLALLLALHLNRAHEPPLTISAARAMVEREPVLRRLLE